MVHLCHLCSEFKLLFWRTCLFHLLRLCSWSVAKIKLHLLSHTIPCVILGPCTTLSNTILLVLELWDRQNKKTKKSYQLILWGQLSLQHNDPSEEGGSLLKSKHMICTKYCTWYRKMAHWQCVSDDIMCGSLSSVREVVESLQKLKKEESYCDWLPCRNSFLSAYEAVTSTATSCAEKNNKNITQTHWRPHCTGWHRQFSHGYCSQSHSLPPPAGSWGTSEACVFNIQCAGLHAQL